MQHVGLVAVQPVGSSSLIRDIMVIPSVGRRILNHWTLQVPGKHPLHPAHTSLGSQPTAPTRTAPGGETSGIFNHSITWLQSCPHLRCAIYKVIYLPSPPPGPGLAWPGPGLQGRWGPQAAVGLFHRVWPSRSSGVLALHCGGTGLAGRAALSAASGTRRRFPESGWPGVGAPDM